MNTSIRDYGPGPHEVRSRLDDRQRQRLYLSGFASLITCLGIWGLTLAGVVLAPWWAKVPLAMLNGLTISILFVVGHDGGHGVLFPSRWLNRFGGRLALLPALHPYSSWVHSHNRLHHAFTNIKEKDPGFPPLSLADYRALSSWRRWLYRQQRTWYGIGLLYFVDMWLKWEMFPSTEHAPKNRRGFVLDRIYVALFAIAWIGGLVYLTDVLDENVWAMLLVGFVIPQAAWNWLIAFTILQQHTHPRIAWFSERDSPAPSYFQMQVRATPHVIFPAPFRFMMRHIMEHTAHHADMTIPHYHLAEAQSQIEKAYRREILRILWTPGGFLRMLRVCRLYDYVTHRWLNYDGTPTTEELLTDEPTASETSTAAVA